MGVESQNKAVMRRKKARVVREKNTQGLLFDPRRKITPKVLDVLRIAFETGATDKEACALAKISPATLYNYQTQHPGFVEQKEAMKETVTGRARLVAGKGASEDVRAAQWWLERKRSEEFNPKHKIDISVVHEIAEVDVDAKLLKLLQKYDPHALPVTDSDVIDI